MCRPSDDFKVRQKNAIRLAHLPPPSNESKIWNSRFTLAKKAPMRPEQAFISVLC